MGFYANLCNLFIGNTYTNNTFIRKHLYEKYQKLLSSLWDIEIVFMQIYANSLSVTHTQIILS